MAIKRFTIELDDSPREFGQTSLPEELKSQNLEELKGKSLTRVPSHEEFDETNSPLAGLARPRAIGRTFPDLVVEYKNDPRVMTTVLMIIPFVVYVPKTLLDFIYPLLAGVIFNGVWFLTPLIAKLRDKKQ